MICVPFAPAYYALISVNSKAENRVSPFEWNALIKLKSGFLDSKADF